ncbi:glutamyl aminopeptidase-like isoform X1 [Uranotaenia lowii]|uniref:glutamyl aminopeptidase-like isoform X1 n=1 Tax=Uranotaenia lowii TaxID=190385 RepID=UPI00247AFC5E|nr:glutamyl aminopeptidase-like isoform X1 [Uranotaenia lowii]XP_055587829.1 glutamyl aminopeptidase-like isoform X1 [Uranotaenia lowii]XP_055587830.1 glutamyl aminopeptidase-like isoform X1 [Uranotaenia lowii]
MTAKIQHSGQVVGGACPPSAIRPSSHFPAQRNSMLSSSASLKEVTLSKRRSILILSLIATCVFLFVLCLCLLSALVLIGKNLSAQSSPPLFSSYLLSRIPILPDQTLSADDDDANNNKSKASKSLDSFDRPSSFDQDNLDSAVDNNRTAIFLPNSVFTGTTVGMNVLKMGASEIVKKLSFRLPRHIKPKHYDLLMNPDLEQGTFTGQVRINITISEPTDYVVLHSNKLAITDTFLNRVLPNKSETKVQIKKAYAYDTHQYWVVETESIDSGEYRLGLDFEGNLTNQIVGFYSSTYRDKGSNATRKIATSKFEPTFARQAFPCFDEPQLKATYAISLVYPSSNGYHALSNMDLRNTLQNSPATGLNTAVFNPSVPMSTYLVVFIVSDFLDERVTIRPKIGEPFELRVFATPFQMNNVRFARDTAEKIIQHYIEYFDIPYPLPKLDMAAIPDFVSGAMETWGLVTYRETSILYNAETSSTQNKQRVAEVIAHELAHMWFGNLVTMKWWNELWLNEGFASYIEYKGVHAAYEKWGIMEQFTIDNLHGVLTLDATIGSHPIVVKVENPHQITEIFDTITYSKGASVIRMLEDFVSEPIFKRGVTAYLNKLQYNNGVSDDLMEELDKIFTDATQSGATVAKVMDTFTKQKGFPVITVRRVGNQFRLTQERFLADPNAKETETSPFDYKWFVPLTYVLSNNAANEQRKWFPNTDSEVSIDVPGNDANAWIKLNMKQVGYYRVNYPVSMWQQFSSLLSSNINAFAIGDRTGLLNDAFALADAGRLSYDVALELTKFLKQETEYVPWATVASKMKSIRNLIYDYDSYYDIISYVRELVETAYETVSWTVNTSDDADHMKNRLRTTILDLACSFGHEKCLQEAGNQFRSWLDQGTVIHPDVRTVVYYYGVQQSASIQDWQKVKEKFRNENDANEKIKLMSALAAFPDAKVLRAFLDEAWDPQLIREQDHLSCVQNVAANKHGEQVAWDHVRANWDRFVERFTLGERNLGRMIPSITGRFSTKVRLMELEDFFSRNPEAGAGATARTQALENISNNIQWLERNQKIIADWLKNSTR